MSVSRLAEQFAKLRQQHDAARLGVWAFLGSELLLFTGLFALYTGYRAEYPDDFARAAQHNNIFIGTANTLILITSSFTVALALHAVRNSRQRVAAAWLALSIGLGALFLSLKGIEYAEHFRSGIYPGAAYRFKELDSFGARTFFTLYFLTTGLHAIHVTAGLCVLVLLAVGCLRRRYDAEHQLPVELGALYWHLVDVIWIFLWPLLYLLQR